MPQKADIRDDDPAVFEEGQAEAIAVMALEGVLSPRDLLVLHNMFPPKVLNAAASQMEAETDRR